MRKLFIITAIVVVILTIVIMIPNEIKVDNKKEIIDLNLLEYVDREEGYSKEDLKLLERLRNSYHGTLCAPGENGFWSFKNPLYVSKTQTDLCKYLGEYNMYISENVIANNKDKNDVHIFDEILNNGIPQFYVPPQQGYAVTTYNKNFIEPFKTINQKLIDLNKTYVYYQFVEEMTIFDKLEVAMDADNLVFVDTPAGTYLLYISPYRSSSEQLAFSFEDRKQLSVLALNPPILIIFVFIGFVAISFRVWKMIRIPKTKTRSNIFKKEQ